MSNNEKDRTKCFKGQTDIQNTVKQRSDKLENGGIERGPDVLAFSC